MIRVMKGQQMFERERIGGKMIDGKLFVLTVTLTWCPLLCGNSPKWMKFGTN